MIDSTGTRPGRRAALRWLGGAASAALVAPPMAAAAMPQKVLDPTDRDQLALAFRKLAYSADETVTYWWMHGTRYGVIDSVATPFWDMHIGTWFTTRDVAPGRFKLRSASANFYTVPGTSTRR